MIRKLTRDDWEQYKDVRLRSLQTDPDVYFSTYKEVSNWNDSSFRAEISSLVASHFGYYGAFESNTLVGYISLSPQYFAKQSHIADIFNLYVSPESRGKGIAKSLVAAVLTSARESGTLEKLFLSVMSQNAAAISLYTTHGFTIYGTKSRSLKIDGKYFDEVLMQYDLLS